MLRPASTLSVKGGAAIGTTYAGSNAAGSNNLIVQGSVGIGTTSPQSALETVYSGLYSNNESQGNGIQTSTGHTSGTDYTLYMGADKTNHLSYLQSVNWGTAVAPLALNARGGYVGIGTTVQANSAALTVNGAVSASNFIGSGTQLTGVVASTVTAAGSPGYCSTTPAVPRTCCAPAPTSSGTAPTVASASAPMS